MVAASVSAVLAAALLPVVAYCAYSLVRRLRHPDEDPVPVDVVAWHGAMGAVMLVALSGSVAAGWDWLGAALFVVAVLWCVLRTSSGRAAGHYPRLFLMSGAMAAMLVPAGPATAATQADGSMGMAQAGSPEMLLSGTGAFVVALAMASVAVAAVRVAGHPAPVRTRISACCEVAMAGAMVVMAAALI